MLQLFKKAALFVGVLGGVMIFAAQTDPSEAESNLAKWAAKIGIDKLPEWINTSLADDYTVLIGYILLIIALTFYLVIARLSRNKSKEVNRPEFKSNEPNDKHLEPDWPIGEAITYVVSEMFPDSDPQHINHSKEYKIAPEEMVKKIKSGVIQTWGKRIKVIDKPMIREVIPYIDQESFTVEDWTHRKLKSLEACINSDTTPQTHSVGRSNDDIQFTALQVNRNQIKNIQWLRCCFIPVSEAAGCLYGDLRQFDKGHWHVKLAESCEDSEDGILTYFAICISLHTNIYGKRPPSNNFEKIDKTEWKRGSFKNEGNEFWYFHANKPKYIKLAINSNDLPLIFQILKSQNELRV